MKTQIFTATVLGLLIGLSQGARAEQDINLVANSRAPAKFESSHGSANADSTITMNLKTSWSDIQRGQVYAKDINVALHRLPQKLITGRRTSDYGGLGFVANAKPHKLSYNAQNLTLKGVIAGKVDFTALTGMVEQKIPDGSDYATGKPLDAKMSVLIKLADKLDPDSADRDLIDLSSVVDLEIKILGIPELQIVNSRVVIRNFVNKFKYTSIYRYEVVRRLCVQPVRFKPTASSTTVSGAGLPFGQPGAITEWRKADVVFQFRPWKTITNSSFSTVTQSEMSAVRQSVQDSDCIEVFFVNQFSPMTLFGGGASFSSGLSEAQIITSDDNADFGVDLTHLAHELGHVLSLTHPLQGFPNSDRPWMTDGNTGTLMCPSGFNNDNPAINSQGNKSNSKNPLLTYWLMPRQNTLDCSNNSDCGPCN